MSELKITKFRNAFSIKDLRINNNSQPILFNNVIYAPNGVFKTSFARTFYNISNDELVEERIKHKPFEYDVIYGDKNINDVKKNVLVFSRDIMNNFKLSGNMYNLINSLALIPDLQNKMKLIWENINQKYDIIVNILKQEGIPDKMFENILQIKNSEDKHNLITGFYHVLCHAEFIENDHIMPDELLFSTSYDKLDKEEFRIAVKDYHNYIVDLTKSTFFDEKFTVFAAQELLKTLKETGFLNKNRTITIDDVVYDNYSEIELLVNEKINSILSTDDAIERAKKVQKCIGKKTKNDRELSSIINSEIKVVELMTYPRWVIKQSQLKRKYEYLINEISDFLSDINAQLDELEENAKLLENNFDKAISIFKTRFSPKFDIKITNRNILALGIERVYPIVEFYHNSEDSIKLEEDNIVKILSSGEKNTLDILKFIVMYENIKNNAPLIILDDIIETFDYGNRYAFTNYIKDIIANGANVVVLTSNYEFFKNLSSRLEKLSPLGAYEDNGIVRIDRYKELKANHPNCRELKNLCDLYYLLPFSRELAKYKNGDNKYIKYFHIKRGTSQLMNGSLLNLVKKEIIVDASKISKQDLESNYLKSIYKTCDIIMNDKNSFKSFDLSKKIILSMGIRLKLEEIFIKYKGFNFIKENKMNQTTYLIKNCKAVMNNEFDKLCEKINICTPEFIHLNAFMYEPLIDIMPNILINIYEEISIYHKGSKDWKINLLPTTL